MVGAADIVVTLVVVTLFVRAKGSAKCMDACFTVRTRARVVSVSVGRGITDLFDHMQGPEAVRARRQTRIRRNTMDDGIDQVSIRRRTFEAQDSRNINNPFEGIETEANPVVEMVDIRS